MPNKKSSKKKTRKKRVINKVTDNIPEGSELQIPVGIFMAYFGNDLLKHYTPKDKDKK